MTDDGPEVHEGWILLPNGFALPRDEFPMTKPTRHLLWLGAVPVTPWAWRRPHPGSEAVEVSEVVFEKGRPDFGCLCHPPTAALI